MPTAKFMTYQELRLVGTDALWKKLLAAKKRGAVSTATIDRIKAITYRLPQRAALIKAVKASQVYYSRRDRPGYAKAATGLLAGESWATALSDVVDSHILSRMNNFKGTVKADVRTMRAAIRGQQRAMERFRKHILGLLVYERFLRETIETRMKNLILAVVERELSRLGRTTKAKNYKANVPKPDCPPKKVTIYRKKIVR